MIAAITRIFKEISIERNEDFDKMLEIKLII